MNFGIDVSYFQSIKYAPVGVKKIDWSIVFNNGFRFFYARACDGMNGTEAGFVGGSYQFGHPSMDAVALAAFFYNMIRTRLVDGNLRPVIDMESLNADHTVPLNAGAWTLAWLKAFVSLSGDIKPIVYASTSYMYTMLQQSPELKAFLVLEEDFWDAEYHADADPTKMPTHMKFVAWQYAGNVARQPGFTATMADLDMTPTTSLEALMIRLPAAA